jgi:dTDP-4-amino-4,6-dideoxy-D-glucose acyltransferase
MSDTNESGQESQRFASIGDAVAIDPSARVLGAERLSLGSNVRIDAFVVISAGAGGITIGDHVHIAAHCFLAGTAAIRIEDFANVSGRVSIYSSNDDYSGESLMGPTIPSDYTNVTDAPVTLKKHSIVGAGSIILPGVTLAEGAGVAALSLVKEDVEPFEMVGGVPAKRIGSRARTVLELERKLRGETGGS